MAGPVREKSVTSGQTGPSGPTPTAEAPALRVKTEPSPDDWVCRTYTSSSAHSLRAPPRPNSHNSHDSTRVAKREAVDAADQLRIAELEAAQRTLDTLQRQKAALEALITTNAGADAERTADVEQEARRAALLRDEVERHATERASATQQEEEEEQAYAAARAEFGKAADGASADSGRRGESLRCYCASSPSTS